MQGGAVLSQLRTIAGLATPPLRVIGLTYTGLGGMLALALVVSVALVPVGPALQQVAEPARQAMSNLVQPTSDAVTVFFGGAPTMHVEASATVASPTRTSGFSDAVNLDVTIADSVEAMPADEPMAVVAARSGIRAPLAEAQSPAPEAVDEIVGLEPIDVSAPHPVEPVVVLPAPTTGLQIASHDPPKALPVPAPIETPLQTRVRLDAENQAAIDAARAAQVRTKADADAANNAAIAANKAAATATATGQNASATVSPAATASAAATPANTTVTNIAPTGKGSDSAKATATATATPQSKAAANAGNQAAIDAAKLARARAKGEANAANHAALLASKTAKPVANTTPTAKPTSAATQPTVQPTRTISAVESPQPTVSVDVVEQQVEEASFENAPADQASTPPSAA